MCVGVCVFVCACSVVDIDTRVVEHKEEMDSIERAMEEVKLMISGRPDIVNSVCHGAVLYYSMLCYNMYAVVRS